MLKAGPAACWLWVCGLAHAQSQLTDGFIAEEALAMIGVHGKARSQRLADTLVTVRLFDRVEGGYRVHDYLAFNATREEALARRGQTKEARVAAGRLGGLRSAALRRQANGQANGKQTVKQSSSNAAKQSSSPIPSHPIPTPLSDDNGGVSARSKRPIFVGQKLTVFDWQLDDCVKTLGNCLDQFDLHEWFFALDAAAMQANLVIPKRDGGVWLQAQLVAEAQRRGLPLQMATAPQMGKSTSRLAAAVANIKAREDA